MFKKLIVLSCIVFSFVVFTNVSEAQLFNRNKVTVRANNNVVAVKTGGGLFNRNKAAVNVNVNSHGVNAVRFNNNAVRVNVNSGHYNANAVRVNFNSGYNYNAVRFNNVASYNYNYQVAPVVTASYRYNVVAVPQPIVVTPVYTAPVVAQPVVHAVETPCVQAYQLQAVSPVYNVVVPVQQYYNYSHY